MPKDLTEKQLKVIELMMLGKSQLEAVKEVYSCDNPSSAYVVNHNLSKNESFKVQLRSQLRLKEEIVKGEGRKYVEILEELMPKEKVAQIFAELIDSGDTERVKLEAIKEYHKVFGSYPDLKVGLYRDFESEREKILSPADLPRLIAENKLAEEKTALIEEAVIKEDGIEESNTKEDK